MPFRLDTLYPIALQSRTCKISYGARKGFRELSDKSEFSFSLGCGVCELPFKKLKEYAFLSAQFHIAHQVIGNSVNTSDIYKR